MSVLLHLCVEGNLELVAYEQQLVKLFAQQFLVGFDRLDLATVVLEGLLVECFLNSAINNYTMIVY